MRYFLYNVLQWILVLPGFCYLVCSRRHRALIRRFAPKVPQISQHKILWVHGCSVGEVLVAKVLVRALRKTYPDAAIVLTVNTVSGYELAVERIDSAYVTWAPFDLSCCVRCFIKKLRPAVLILLETELWPGLVRETRRQDTPVVVVNGRLSPRKFPKYEKYSWLMPPVMPYVSHVAAQEALYGDRFVALGMAPDCITITGNMKYDGVLTAVSDTLYSALREELGFSEEDVLLVFGSTRPGDEHLAAECWKALKREYDHLCFIIAPRHLNRLDEGLAAFKGENVVLRSQLAAHRRSAKERVLFLDSIGELGRLYALCRIAVIGGSFYAGVEGHNPLEPAALGVATVFGPYMGNFPDAAEMLLKADGAVQASAPEELPGVLRQLLDNPECAQELGAAGRRVIMKNQGAVTRTLDTLERFL